MHRTILLYLALVSSAASSLRAQDKDPDALFREGVTAFFDAKPAESVAAFDKLIALAPNAAPQLWQRGLSLYYAEKYQEGREQFELHQTVNPNDVENAAWHFICVAKKDGVEAARKVLIPIKGDTRVPMKEVHDLFAGSGTEEDVMKAANAGADDDAKRNHLCYAHLYLGLYHEALGHVEQAKAHMLKAAVDYKMDHYMGKCAQVHVKLRGWK
jgi:lipoprotein NlpI